MKNKKRIVWILMALWSLMTVLPVRAEEEELSGSDLYATAAVLMDGETGRVLYEKNGDQAMANASTTKILTCILVLEESGLREVAEASARAAGQPRVHLGMQSGQHFYVEDLLYALMLESFNDCAVVLAEHVAGSVEAFAELMNEKAAQIGCGDSYFVTPNGLDGEDENGVHHTTAVDLAKIMRYCILESPRREKFLEITGTSSYDFQEVEGRQHYQCQNHNALLTMMEGAISGKTGFTNDAGYCYVGAAEQEGQTYVVSLLACGWPPSRNYKWLDAGKLMGYGFRNFRTLELSGQMENLPEILLAGYRQTSLLVQQEGVLDVTVQAGERVFAIVGPVAAMSSDRHRDISGDPRSTILPGEPLSEVDYYIGNEYVGSLTMEAGSGADPLQWEDHLEALWKTFLGAN